MADNAQAPDYVPQRPTGRFIPTQIPPTELPGVNSLLTLMVGVVVIAAFYVARDVLIPVTLAILLSFLLAPLAAIIRKSGLGRTPSVLLAVAVALALMVAVGTVIAMQIANISEEFPRYQTSLHSKLNAVSGFGSSTLRNLESRLDPVPAQALRPPSRAGSAAPRGTAQSPVAVEIQQSQPTPIEIVREVLGPILSPLATAALVIMVSIFILLQEDDLRDRMIRLFGSSDLHGTTQAMNDAARRLSKYFLTQLGINTGFGLLIAIGLYFMGVPSAALWGLIAMLLRFVPYVGVYIAACAPVALAAAVSPGWALAAWTLALFVGTELIIGQVVEPFAYGHSTGLSPVSIVVSTIFWTWIWGPIGLLLATPLTLCLVVLGRHVKRMEFLDVLLGDRPPLTPVESLYQRLLANDPEDAASQAEVLLKERSLSLYYDEVAVKALLLAAQDVARGVLTRDRQIVMRDAIFGLVEDLDDYGDATPDADDADDGAAAPPPAELALPRTPPLDRVAPAIEKLPGVWQGASAIVCLGGRSPSARLELHDAAARPGRASLDLTNVGAVCISYTADTGTPTHLGFLLRRLQRRAPDLPVIVGIWGSDGRPEWELPSSVVAARTLRTALSLSIDAAWAAAASPMEPQPLAPLAESGGAAFA
jgi:predicted PurR-regulated permease PerM